MTPILAFDIETIPDCPGIRRLYKLPEDLPDAEVAEVAFQKRRAVAGNDFLPPHLQRVVVISCVLRHDDEVWVFSIGEPDATEPVAIQRFFDGINRYAPQIVSWNGRNFDLPVLVARGLIHGVTAACFWDTGQDNKDDEVSRLAGYPGKLGVGGAAVWDSYRQGAIASIRDYCETDCANTYLLYLRFQMMRCALTREQYERESALLRSFLEKQNLPHWAEFLSLWKS